jgi:hypothetical protein
MEIFSEQGVHDMLIGDTLPFIADFVEELDRGMQQLAPKAALTPGQKDWLGFCLQGILVTFSLSYVTERHY